MVHRRHFLFVLTNKYIHSWWINMKILKTGERRKRYKKNFDIYYFTEKLTGFYHRGKTQTWLRPHCVL